MSATPIELGSFWLPKQSSTLAPEIDSSFNFVLYVCLVFFVGIVAAALWFAIRYRKRKGNTIATTGLDHSLKLEVTWTILPAILLLGLFMVGFKGFVSAHVAPADALEVKVTAEKWMWTFSYPDGTVTTNELGVPKDRPVKLIMSSKDIVHSFYVPEFRVKQDVVPGAYTLIWFQATEAKEVALLCAEYCGTGHSDMLGKVTAMDESKFKEWLANGGSAGDPKMPPAERGKMLFNQKSCSNCHSVDGTRIQGPSLKGVFGRNEQLEGGANVLVDENYIRESLMDPQAKIVKGYPGSMPTFRGLLKDKDVDAIIAYLKTVN
jgi:cytochrome c oxidase subunit 2